MNDRLDGKKFHKTLCSLAALRMKEGLPPWMVQVLIATS